MAARHTPARLVALNKPFDVLSQFGQGSTPPAGGGRRRTLADLVDVPGVYPAGRLDRDSEGLLLLTDDGRLQQRIAGSRIASRAGTALLKRYLVQVEGEPDEAALHALRGGLALKDGPARALEARFVSPPGAPPALWPRDPPVRVRRAIPTAWIELAIDEGRNRQVRRMTAAVGYPTLRLVRIAIGPWTLGDLAPGGWRDEDATRLAQVPRAPQTAQWPRSTE